MMTEKYVKLSDIKGILAEAGLVTEYYDDGYESVTGYNIDDVNDGLAELHIYEFENPDTQDQKTVEETERAYNSIREREANDLKLIAAGLERLKKNGTEYGAKKMDGEMEEDA